MVSGGVCVAKGRQEGIDTGCQGSGFRVLAQGAALARVLVQ